MLSDLLYRVRALFRRKHLEDDLDAELKFHLDQLTEKHVQAGLAPAESSRLARIELGGLEQVKEECRQSWGLGWIDTLLRDSRYAFARMSRYPRSAVVIGTSLALGISANTLMFSIFNASRNPTHFERTHELVQIYESDRLGRLSPASGPNYRAMKELQRSLAAVAAYSTRAFSISDRLIHPELVDGVLVSPDLFRVLGIQPILGRTFEGGEFNAGGPGAVIVSHGFWRSRLSARDDVLGEPLTVNGNSHAIVGVMPSGFQFPFSSDVWLPWIGLLEENRRLTRNLQVVGRMSAGATTKSVEAELGEILARAEQDRGVVIIPLIDALTGGARMSRIISFLLVTAGFLLLVVCLNVASIRSADFVSRQRETATYLALGASRGDVVQRFLTESVLVALLGGAAGVIGAHWAIRYLTAKFASDIPYWMEIRLDEAALSYTFGLSVLVGIISGLQPALQSSRTPLRALQEGQGGSRRAANLLKLFVLVQVAAAVLLLVGTKTAIDGLRNVQSRDLGFSLEGALTTSVPLLSDRFSSAQSQRTATTELIENARSIPGVSEVAAVNPMPMKDGWNTTLVDVPDGHAASDGTEQILVADYQCTPNYFSVTKIRLLAGESFRETGGSVGRREAIINRRLARSLWGDDPLAATGRSITVAGQTHLVIGVVEDSYHDPRANEPPHALYRQLAAVPTRRLSLLVQSNLPAEALQRPLADAAQKSDPTLAISSLMSMRSLFAESISISRASTHTLAVVSVVALILALAGIYGMAASLVKGQSRELAIRRALGSSSGRAVSLVLKQTSLLTATGVLVGTALTIPMLGLLRSGFFGIADYPVTSYCGAWLAIGATSLAAATLAAYTDVRREPCEGLRR